MEELEFITRFQLQASPAVLARGMFGMLRYDATAALKAISVPALALAGNKDSVCKPEASERMQRNVPRAQLAKLTLAPKLPFTVVFLTTLSLDLLLIVDLHS